MLSIDHQLVRIKKVTGVEEFKGDKRDYGCSVRIEWVAPNVILDEFDRHARTAFYERDTGKPGANAEGQGELSLPRQDVELTKRKCVNIVTPLHFVKELDGYTIIFHRGATEKSEIKLTEVKLDDFTADPHDGGSCLMGCNAYMKPPVEQRGYIDHMSKTEIEITLTPPQATQTDLVDKAKGRGKKKTVAEKADQDPFANTDIPPPADGEQASRDGTAWPFPSPGAAHGDGTEPPVDEGAEQTE